MTYFASFPRFYYNGKIARNITLRTSFLPGVLDTATAFYPYYIQGIQRADTIAEKYYGSADYAWLVYFCIQLSDPYYEWPMLDDEFIDFIVNKYGSIESAETTVHHYVYNADNDPTDIEAAYRATYEMDPQTFSFLSAPDKGFWTPVYCMDYEMALNDEKRTIRLLDRDLLSQAESELKALLNG